MNDEMILVPRAELLAWAKAWLNDYDPNDGTDCVTPFDTYLLKSPVEAQAVESAEDRFEHFLQAAIARSAEPLRELGEYLAGVLDEDQWPTADRLLLQLATAPPSAPVGVEAIAAEIRASLGRGATVSTRRRWADELEALSQQPAAVDVCLHEWLIWPETDGFEQRCSRCGSHRPTPKADRDAALAQQPAAPHLHSGEWPEGSPRSAEAAKAYIRDWCPDYVKDYIAALAQQPAPTAYRSDALDLAEEDADLEGSDDALTQQPVAVDGAMVERAQQAYRDMAEAEGFKYDDECVEPHRTYMRAALTAALAAQQGGVK